MSDLISRQDIEWHDYLVADGNGMYHNEKVAYKSQVDDLPSAQPEPKCADGCIYGWGSDECKHCDVSAQPEIIRCKDCKWSDWYTIEEGGKQYCHCIEADRFGWTADDYCSYAERRTE